MIAKTRPAYLDDPYYGAPIYVGDPSTLVHRLPPADAVEAIQQFAERSVYYAERDALLDALLLVRAYAEKAPKEALVPSPGCATSPALTLRPDEPLPAGLLDWLNRELCEIDYGGG